MLAKAPILLLIMWSYDQYGILWPKGIAIIINSFIIIDKPTGSFKEFCVALLILQIPSLNRPCPSAKPDHPNSSGNSLLHNPSTISHASCTICITFMKTDGWPHAYATSLHVIEKRQTSELGKQLLNLFPPWAGVPAWWRKKITAVFFTQLGESQTDGQSH